MLFFPGLTDNPGLKVGARGHFKHSNGVGMRRIKNHQRAFIHSHIFLEEATPSRALLTIANSESSDAYIVQLFLPNYVPQFSLLVEICYAKVGY